MYCTPFNRCPHTGMHTQQANIPCRHACQRWAPAAAQQRLHAPADCARETDAAPDCLQPPGGSPLDVGQSAAARLPPPVPAGARQPCKRAGVDCSTETGRLLPALSGSQLDHRFACICGRATEACKMKWLVPDATILMLTVCSQIDTA